MSDRPRFTAAPRPTIPGFPHMVDVAGSPRCECGVMDVLDATTGLCRDCWRVEEAFLRWLIRVEAARGATVANLAAAREAREVPRLTDAAGPAGASLEVALEPPSNLGKPRRRT